MYQRAVILTRLSEQAVLERRYGTVSQARFLMAQTERGAAAFGTLERLHLRQEEAARRIRLALPPDLRVAEIDRSLVAQFVFEPKDIVIALGQDGLVANVAKYLDGQPIVGVNPDPESFEGALLPFTGESVLAALPDLLRGSRPTRRVTLAEAVTNDGQVVLGFNEIFIGLPNHQSARYSLSFRGKSEVQSSSGVIVATGSGSTGWLRSLLGTQADLDPVRATLRFCVREAWPGRGFSALLLRGDVTVRNPLVIESRMANGVLFADGIEPDAVAFDAGMTVRITPAERKAVLVQ